MSRLKIALLLLILFIGGLVFARVMYVVFPKNKIVNRSARIIIPYYYRFNSWWYGLNSEISFTAVKLVGANPPNPTSLQFGPDGKLYVASQHGSIFRYTIEQESSHNFRVTDTEVIDIINTIPNYDDRGNPDSTITNRQIAGILVVGTSEAPVVYVTSSDPRTGGAEMAAASSDDGDINLDTNSGIISVLTRNAEGWEKLDLVRGLPRSEEFHSLNGMQLDPDGVTLYVMSGGNTNAGAPSINFGKITEFALSACLLKVHLDQLRDMPIKGEGNNRYVYDLPTVDDPERENLPDGSDPNDPFGGNDGLNQARLVPDGPVEVYATGYRNAFDVVLTRAPGREGRLYTVDNGPNRGWGGYPEHENTPEVTNNYQPDEPGSINNGVDDESVNNLDNLHLIYKPGMKAPHYGGHPTPIRANPATAGLFWKNEEGDHFSVKPTVDWPPVPVELANQIESNYQSPGADDGALATFDHSTNGMAEYFATDFFDGALTGDLLEASFNGAIFRTKLNDAGTRVLFKEVLAEGFAILPLDITAQGDYDIFPGTVWIADFQGNSIFALNPVSAPKWEAVEVANHPTQRHEAAFAAVGDTFYLVGGRGQLPVDAYDPRAHTWRPVSELPDNLEVNHFQAVSLNDKLYVLGALTGPYPSEKSVPDIFVYDPGTNTWATHAGEIPAERLRGAAAAVGFEGNIYVVGGSTNGHSNGSVSWTDVYDPVSGSWTPLSDSPHARDHFQVAVHNGKLYAIGGRRTNASANRVFDDLETAVDVYDIATDTWTTLPQAANVPTARAGATTVVFDDQILVIGGESTQSSAHNEVEAFSPETQTWRKLPPLLTGRHGTQAVVFDNKIYIAAGSANQGGGPELNTLEAFTPGTIINCTGSNNSTTLDDDDDGYSNKDESDNGTNPCSPASKPADADGDSLSDLRDLDDDNDNVRDFLDPFHLDPLDGSDRPLPAHFPFLNGDPGKGLFGMGFTGLMHNVSQDPGKLFDTTVDGFIMGGAAGMATLPAGKGNALSNDQEQGFQVGVSVTPTSAFVVESRLVSPYFATVPLENSSNEVQGIFLGSGDQDNYVAICLTPNKNNPGIVVWAEDGGNKSFEQFYPINNILQGNVFLLLDVDLRSGLAQAKYRVFTGSPAMNLGEPFPLGEQLLRKLQSEGKMAAGLMASYRDGSTFGATWDFINISPRE
jgi:N-acetylneuraminic acid mutarotase